MSAGARAVVAAAWPVEDEPASWFARSLYGKLLSGSTFGAAVRTARLEAYRADPGSSTWAAYQCYGDPGFRLERRRRGVQRAPEIVSRSELDRQIRVISLQAADAGRPGDVLHEVVRRRLRDELVDLVDWADAERSSWLDAAVYHQLGFAASEVGALDHAVAWYRAALDSGKAHAPIEAVEQLGNMEIRLAQQLHRAGEPERVASLVAASRHHLIGALRLGRTVERHGLLGSHFKKRATMTSGAERRRLLERAAEQYGLGAARNRAVSYTVFNALQLDHLLGRDVAERRSCIDELDHEGEPSYWGLATHGDAMLTRLVLGDHVHAGVVSAYRHAFSYRSTWRERSSTLEHLRDLIDLTDGTELQLALIEVHEDLLEWLRTALGQED